MPDPKKPEGGGKPQNNYIKYAGLGFEILACMILFVGAGYALDQWLQPEKPWFTLGFSLLGCVGAILLMIRSIK